MTLRALVKEGRVRIDEPTTLPEGTVLDLVLDDEGDDLDEAERRALHARLLDSLAAAQQGKVNDAAEILKELRAR